MIKKVPLASLYADKKFLLERVMAHLEKIFVFKKDDIADFSDTLFVLPSGEAGRLFREKAALFFHDHGGVTELHTLLPEHLIFNPASVEVNSAQVLNLWLDVLKNHDHSDKPLIFPVDIDFSDESLLNQGAYFAKVRENILLESGLDSEDFISALADSTLKNKLEEYLKLEKCCREKLGSLRDKAQIIADAPLPNPDKIKNIILIECTEIKNGIVKFLENAAENINVIHCLNIREDELDNFDAAGRPITEKMLRSNSALDIKKSFRSYSNPVAEAIKISSLLDKDNLPSSIGVLDSGLASSLAHLLEQKGIEIYAPQKKTLNSFYWFKLFNRLLELRHRDIPFEDVFSWLLDDTFMNYCAGQFDNIEARKEMEKLQRDHLITDFDSLASFCRKYEANEQKKDKFKASAAFCRTFDTLRKSVKSIDENSLPEELWSIFSEIAAFNTLEYMDANTAEISLEALKNIIVQLRKIADPSVRMMIFKHICSNESIDNAEQFKDEAVNFSGFLDLIWYENNSLIIGGISEEAFAGAAAEDMLFPENIRRSLNWSSAYSRFGADIHRFNQLCRQYNYDEILITFASMNKSGSLNSLPRLLFAVDDARLIEHCELLFNDKLNEKITGKDNKNIENKLKLSHPVDRSHSNRISVTSLKNYIRCPYTFYLEKVMNCEDLGRELFELQANQSGTIIHSVLEAYGKKYRNDIPNITELKKFCMDEFDRCFYAQLGSTINNIAIMQGAEIKKSLLAFTEYESTFRRSFSKHQIIHPEFKIDVSMDELWKKLPPEWIENLPPLNDDLKNIRIVGKIDRIDLATDKSGEQICNIIDYKSAKKFTTPKDAHLKLTNSSHLSPEAMLAYDDSNKFKTFYFADMQLVIYKLMAQFMREKLNIPPGIPIRCGYFNLPEDTAQTAVVYFDELDDDMLKKGVSALRHLIQKIFEERKFWPPSLQEKYNIADNYFADCEKNDFETETGDKSNV